MSRWQSRTETLAVINQNLLQLFFFLALFQDLKEEDEANKAAMHTCVSVAAIRGQTKERRDARWNGHREIPAVCNWP